jgi:plasmid replication initiation protein
MHPLAGILARWAALEEPTLRAPAGLELREMSAPKGRLVFLFNHAKSPASVEFERTLERRARSVREILTGYKVHAAAKLVLRTEVPAQGVRVYRIDF